jgi:hypothetical protein
MSDPVEVTDSVVATVSEHCPEVSDEHVAMVLAAWNAVQAGEPVGTIKKDPVTGNLAVRVSENGIHQWKVTAPDGGMWSDLQPTLAGWDKLS